MAEDSGAAEVVHTSAVEADVRLQKAIYSREAVLRASYWFTDRAYVAVSQLGESHLQVRLRLKEFKATLENPNPPSLETVVREFLNAVLDAQLRREIHDETAGVRELILAKAFAEAGILEDLPPGSFNDPVDDKMAAGLVQIDPPNRE